MEATGSGETIFSDLACRAFFDLIPLPSRGSLFSFA